MPGGTPAGAPVRDPRRAPGAGSVDSLEQLAGRGELKAAGQDHDRLQTGGALAALQQADLGAVQVADVCECLLGKAHTIAMVAKVGGELLAYGIHGSNSRGTQTRVPQTNVPPTHCGQASPRTPPR